MMRVHAAVAALVAVLSVVPACAETPVEWTIELSLRGERIEGMPLAFNSEVVHLLGRDGRLWSFAPGEAENFRKTSGRFHGYSPSELRAALLRELGGGFEVSGTTHYMVAHPAGQRDVWAQRFEDLYRSFVHYFSVRGFEPEEPKFPLVGIVCHDRREFLRYSATQGGPASRGVTGYYSPQSNRIVVYDLDGAANHPLAWQATASNVIHEATHQTAFNTGIHSRLVMPPVWLAEGLATLFEAPGVYDGGTHRDRSDRVNRGRLAQFRKRAEPRHQPEVLAELIASDRLFRSDPSLAYAEAWALTFYLVEIEPGKYAEYLARTADRPQFETYTATQRTSDFTAIFGHDWRMLEARFLRFMAGVE